LTPHNHSNKSLAFTTHSFAGSYCLGSLKLQNLVEGLVEHPLATPRPVQASSSASCFLNSFPGPCILMQNTKQWFWVDQMTLIMATVFSQLILIIAVRLS
jgi:hypothetical protein